MIADHLEDGVGQVNLLADDAGVEFPSAFGGFGDDAAETGAPCVEGVKPLGGRGDVAVFLAEVAFGELAHVGCVLGGGERAVGRGEKGRVFLGAAGADGERGGCITCRRCVGRELAAVQPTQNADSEHDGDGKRKTSGNIDI